jgi:hypothetical protein
VRGSGPQPLVCRIPGSGQAQCTPRRDFAPFDSSTHRAFHGDRTGKSYGGGLAGGCEIRSARTHNTNCIKRGNTMMMMMSNDRKAAALAVHRKGVLGIKVLLDAGVCCPREKLARSITSLDPALTLTTPCLCSLLLRQLVPKVDNKKNNIQNFHNQLLIIVSSVF